MTMNPTRGNSSPYRLAHQVYQGKLGVATTARVAEAPSDQFSHAEAFVPLPNENQTSIGSHAGSLKGDAQQPVEGELHGLIFALTHQGSTSCVLRRCLLHA